MKFKNPKGQILKNKTLKFRKIKFRKEESSYQIKLQIYPNIKYLIERPQKYYV